MTSRAMAAAVWLVALVSLAGGAEGQLVQYTDNATGWTSSESGGELISDAQCRVVRPGARTPRASDARARAEARFRANLRRFRGARAPGRAPRPARVGAPGTRSPGRAVASALDARVIVLLRDFTRTHRLAETSRRLETGVDAHTASTWARVPRVQVEPDRSDRARLAFTPA